MLSPCIWQVPHALLTRPPLGYEKLNFSKAKVFTYHNPVRLACVRHAASVHPEPGSNSRLKTLLRKVISFRNTETYLFPYELNYHKLNYNKFIFTGNCLIPVTRLLGFLVFRFSVL